MITSRSAGKGGYRRVRAAIGGAGRRCNGPRDQRRSWVFFSRDGERVVASQPYRLEPCARLYLYGYAAYGAGYVKHLMPKMPLYVKPGGGCTEADLLLGYSLKICWYDTVAIIVLKANHFSTCPIHEETLLTK